MSEHTNILSQFLKAATDEVVPSSSGVTLNSQTGGIGPGTISASNRWTLFPDTITGKDLLGEGGGSGRPTKNPAVLQLLSEIRGPEKDLAEKPIVVGEHADVQRYNRKGSPEPKTYTARAKSLAPGAAVGATAGTGISLLVDAASKKGLSVRRALLAAMMGAPAGALIQLAYQGATKDKEEGISSSRLPSAVQGYIDFGTLK